MAETLSAGASGYLLKRAAPAKLLEAIREAGYATSRRAQRVTHQCAIAVPVLGNGRVLALEVMIPNPAIRNLIREDKVHQIYSSMQVGQSKFGMQTFNQALGQLLSRKLISMEEAFARTSDADELKNILATGGGGGMQLPGHTAQSGIPTRAPPGR